MISSRQLESEAEQTRSQLAHTLDELRERITPGQLVDQAFDYAKDSGAGDFVRNLGRQVADNPLPVTLIGAGMAWLMLSNGRRSAKSGRLASDATETTTMDRRAANSADARLGEAGRPAAAAVTDASRRPGEIADRARTAVEEAAQDAKSKMRQTASSLGEGAASLYESGRSRASDAYGQFSDAANRATSTMADSVSDVGQRTAGAGKEFLRLCKEQPLVFAGLGVMIGAAVGALMPSTDTEDRLMGESSDQMKDQARKAAEDQYETAKAAVEGGFEGARAETQSPAADPQTSESGEARRVPAEEHSPSQRSAD